MKPAHVSARPVKESIAIPGCNDMAAVGICRVHDPDPVYCAMLFTARLAVSVIHREVADAHTNPNGAKLVGRMVVVEVAPETGNPVNELRPTPGEEEVDESVYCRAVLRSE